VDPDLLVLLVLESDLLVDLLSLAVVVLDLESQQQVLVQVEGEEEELWLDLVVVGPDLEPEAVDSVEVPGLSCFRLVDFLVALELGVPESLALTVAGLYCCRDQKQKASSHPEPLLDPHS
jgi:hypothetical protein